MAPTCIGYREKVVRIAKCLTGEYRRIVQVICFGGGDGVTHAFSDSDCARCVETRKTASGGVLLVGHCTAKHWSVRDPENHCAVVSRNGVLRSHRRDLRGQGFEVRRKRLRRGPLGRRAKQATLGLRVRSRSCKVRHIETAGLWISGRACNSFR